MNTNTIVSIDDSPLNLQLIESYFEGTNIRIISVNDSTKAEQVIIDKKPDLILLDVIMPEINGYDLCERIKSNPLLKDIPIIFMTAISSPENIIRGFNLGAVDYITKPYHFEELFARVTTQLELVSSKNKLINELNLRKRTEKELKKSYNHFKLAQKAGKVGTWHWFILEDKIFWSEMTYKIFGIKHHKNFLNKTEFFELVLPKDKKRIIDELELAIKNKQTDFRTEYRIYKNKNTIAYIEEVAEIKFDSNGNAVEMVGVLRDITESKLKDVQVKKLSMAIKQSADTIVFTDIDGNIEFANPKFTELTGYSLDEALGENPRILKSGLQSPEFYKSMWQTISSGGVWRGEFHNKAKDGTLFWEKATITPIKNKSGEITNYLAVKSDITESKKAQLVLEKQFKEIKIAKDFSENLIETSNVLIVSLNRKAEIQIFNKYAEKLTGYSKNEVIGKNWFEIFIPKEERSLISSVFIDVLNEMPRSSHVDNVILTKSKAKKDISWSNSTIYDLESNIAGIISIGRDITELLIMQQKLIDQNERLFLSKKQAQESELRFRTLFNKSNDSIIITSFDGFIIDVNDKTIKLLEYTREELIGNKVSLITPIDFIDKRNLLLKKIKKQKTIVFETYNITKFSVEIPIEVSSTVINYLGKNMILSTGRDIRERKESEKKLLTAIIETEEKERQRIAQDLHDGLGPLMSTIKLYVQWLSKPESKANKDELAKKAEQTVEEAYKTLRSISNNLSPHILKNFGFVVALKSFIEKIKELSDIKINLKSNINERFYHVIETITYRILTEVINNTIKHAKANTVNIIITKEKNKIHINYTDNGIGFDVNKVMESQKGMGLFNIENRLKSIGGKINIKSEIGKGIQITLIIEIPE